MELVPTNEEVIALLVNPAPCAMDISNIPTACTPTNILQVALAFRYFQHAKLLSVGLSRRLRADPEIRAMIKELSIVCPNNTAGLPIAYGVCEALRAHQVYWAEKENESAPLRLRQFVEPAPGEKVLLVDDVMRSGRRFTELRDLLNRKARTSSAWRSPFTSRRPLSPLLVIFRSSI